MKRFGSRERMNFLDMHRNNFIETLPSLDQKKAFLIRFRASDSPAKGSEPSKFQLIQQRSKRALTNEVKQGQMPPPQATSTIKYKVIYGEPDPFVHL